MSVYFFTILATLSGSDLRESVVNSLDRTEMFSEVDLDAMRRIRAAIDPDELANRGKMFPDGEAPALLAHEPHPLEAAGVISRE